MNLEIDVTNNTGPEAPWILVCGPSNIGKSTFIKANGLLRFKEKWSKGVQWSWQKGITDRAAYLGIDIRLMSEMFLKNNPNLQEFDPATGKFIRERTKALVHHEVALTSHPEDWPSGWFTEDYIVKRRAIILGISYEEWNKRWRARKKQDCPKSKDTFVRCGQNAIKKLKALNIPYIFVHNKDNYPELNESAFLELINS